jgi:hypothetical protein
VAVIASSFRPLHVKSTAHQDSPPGAQLQPAWWNVVQWDYVAYRYAETSAPV